MRVEPTSRDLADSLSGRHRELVRYLRSRLPSEDDAQDLAQEAYVRLLRLSDDHMIQHPETYLFRIPSNLVHEYWLTSRAGNVDLASDPDHLPSKLQQPDALASQKQALAALKRAIEFLPPIQQTVVLFHRRDVCYRIRRSRRAV